MRYAVWSDVDMAADLKGHGMRYAVWSDVDMAADQIQEKGAGR